MDVKIAGYPAKALSLDNLHFDRAAYQRGEEDTQVSRIMREWDERLLDPVRAARRMDGTLWVYEGQQRCIAAERLGYTHVQGVVLNIDTVADEAWLFDHANGGKRKVNGQYRHRAQVLYGDPVAVRMEAVLQEFGFTAMPTGSRDKMVRCVTTLRSAWGSVDHPDKESLDYGAEALRWTLAVGKPLLAKGNRPSEVFQRASVAGLTWLARHEQEVGPRPDPECLGTVLAVLTPEGLMGRVYSKNGGNNFREWGLNLAQWVNQRTLLFTGVSSSDEAKKIAA
jgi:hypothetical protein